MSNMIERIGLYLSRLRRFSVTSSWFILLFILFFTIAYTGRFFIEYLQSPLVASWDGSFHYALARYYSENIFPHLFGWASGWQMGMPWPLGYPPLVHYVLAIFDWFIPLDFMLIFKTIFVILAISCPLVIYWLVQKVGFDQFESFIATIFSIFFLCLPYQLYGDVGVSYGGTFAEGGSYPQFFSFYLSLFWMYFMIRSHISLKMNILAGVFFALVFVADIPMAEAIFSLYLTIVGYRLIESKGKGFKSYLLSGLVTLGLISFWLLPLMAYENYFVTLTFKAIPVIKVILKTTVFLIFGVFGFLLAIKQKRNDLVVLGLGIIITLIMASIPIYLMFPDLPIQQFRLVSELLFLSGLLGSIVIVRLIKTYRNIIIQGLVTVLVFIPFFVYIPPLYKSYIANATLSDDDKNLTTWLSQKSDGRSTIEIAGTTYPEELIRDRTHLKFNWLPLNNQIAGSVGLNVPHETIWNVFRESSILSPFIQPLRNSFSTNHESFGVECHLCNDSTFYNQDFTNHIKRAQYMGLRYFVLTNKQMVNRFDEEPSVNKIDTYGRWKVYQTQEPVTFVNKLNYSPILVFTDLKNGVRPKDTSYDWLSLNEEWFYQANTDYVFAYSRESRIDRQVDLGLFDNLLLINYQYDDLNEALNRLQEYSKTRAVFALSSSDPLYEKLVELSQNNSRIVLVNRTDSLRNDYATLLGQLTQYVPQLDMYSDVNNFQKDNRSISFEIPNQTENNRWYLVKYSYLPWWKDKLGGKIFMGSPAFMLVNTNRPKASLEITYGNEFRVGKIITIITIVLLIIFAIKGAKLLIIKQFLSNMLRRDVR